MPVNILTHTFNQAGSFRIDGKGPISRHSEDGRDARVVGRDADSLRKVWGGAVQNKLSQGGCVDRIVEDIGGRLYFGYDGHQVRKKSVSYFVSGAAGGQNMLNGLDWAPAEDTSRAEAGLVNGFPFIC